MIIIVLLSRSIISKCTQINSSIVTEPDICKTHGGGKLLFTCCVYVSLNLPPQKAVHAVCGLTYAELHYIRVVRPCHDQTDEQHWDPV